MDQYQKACQTLLHICGNCQPDEKLLIVTDVSSYEVARVFWEAAKTYPNKSMIMMDDRTMHGEEPTALVAAAMMECDIMYRITKFSLSHAKARRRALANGCRDINMADYTLEMLEHGGLFVDFVRQGEVLTQFAQKMKGERLKVIAPGGTRFAAGIAGRVPKPQYGRSLAPGQVASPPDIECAIAAVEGTLNGVVYIDGSIPHPELGLITDEIRLTFEKSMLTDIAGGPQAMALKRILEDFCEPKAYIVGEIGVGLNPCCTLSGRMLEDEGCYRTMHLGLGSSTGFGGTTDCSVHLDMIFKEPTMSIDGVTILSGGEVVL